MKKIFKVISITPINKYFISYSVNKKSILIEVGEINQYLNLSQAIKEILFTSIEKSIEWIHISKSR